ncbi:MAG: asparagine synthase (glutamine-hydrolyzing) [Pseudomonadota bacterium]|nr:asparagine synthase (glutamine-hydrolyzing) [Pseudomonadota bacterium]
MCGIAGIVAFNESNSVDETILTKMRDTMIHRGPDGAANWISADRKVGLAHRRLSIIDLSTAAAQPMCNEDGTVWITLNGEIYNHVVLRKDLQEKGHTFKTDHSDTEVLVHGFEEWGIEGLLQRIEGDYGFGIWDEKTQKLYLVRDRIGVKPVYFSLQEGVFLFASEIKAILAHPIVERDVDPIAMYHYLSFLTTPAPFTMFKGVFKLPAGHYLEIDHKGAFKTKQYWDVTEKLGQKIPDNISEAEQENYYVEGIQSRLKDSVKKRMMSDVPFGVFLSGGIDSSTNVALMSELMDRPVDTFTVGFKDHHHLNELEYASQVSKEFNTNHHEVLIDEHDMKGYLGNLVHHQDEPIADWVCIPLYFVSKLAKDSGTTVIQVGEGADEQFCGYKSYMGYLDLYHKYWSPYRKLPQVLQNLGASLFGLAANLNPSLDVYADIVNRASRNRDHFWSGATVFWDRMKDKLISAQLTTTVASSIMESGILPESYLKMDTFNIINSFGDALKATHPTHDILTRMIYNEFKLRLPELLLMRVDKITMSESLEARVPFLDHHLVEFSMNIPMSHKVKGKQAKNLLKKAVEGLIPHNIIYRKKMGFGAPMSQWLKGEFGSHVASAISQSKLLNRGFFNVDYIQQLSKDHMAGRRDNSLYIWTLFNLTSWYDYWIEQKSVI